MSDSSKSLIREIGVIFMTAMITLLFSFAVGGFNAISKAEAQALIEHNNDRYDAKLDIIIDKLSKLTVSQARIEEQLNSLKDK